MLFLFSFSQSFLPWMHFSLYYFHFCDCCQGQSMLFWKENQIAELLSACGRQHLFAQAHWLLPTHLPRSHPGPPQGWKHLLWGCRIQPLLPWQAGTAGLTQHPWCLELSCLQANEQPAALEFSHVSVRGPKNPWRPPSRLAFPWNSSSTFLR